MATTATVVEVQAGDIMQSESQYCRTPHRDVQVTAMSTPRTQDTTPALTPASELNEYDVESPGTPIKAPSPSHFLQASLPMKIERRTVKLEQDDRLAKNNIWDISFGDVSTKGWLFPQCHELVQETPPTIISSTINFDFDLLSSEQELATFLSVSGTAIGDPKVKRCSLHEAKTLASQHSTPAANEKSSKSITPKNLGPQLLRILPTDTIGRLLEKCNGCVAQTGGKTPRRCKARQKMPGYDPALIAKLVDKRSLSEYKDIKATLCVIHRILPKVLCNSGKHLPAAQSALEVLEEQLDNKDEDTAFHARAQAGDWLKRLARNTPEQPSATPTRPPLRRSARLVGESAPPLAVSVTYEPYYAPGSPKALVGTPELIRATLCRPLLQSDTKEGFLYVFWRKGDFGLVKIGHSKYEPAVRLAQWQKQCGDDAQGCKSTVDKSLQVRVRNVRRLEYLVHAELKEYRRKQFGCRCGKKHIEWFQVDIRLVQIVVEKWTTWLREQPRYLARVGGGLLALEKKELDRICTVEVLASQSKPGVSQPKVPRSVLVQQKGNRALRPAVASASGAREEGQARTRAA